MEQRKMEIIPIERILMDKNKPKGLMRTNLAGQCPNCASPHIKRKNGGIELICIKCGQPFISEAEIPYYPPGAYSNWRF